MQESTIPHKRKKKRSFVQSVKKKFKSGSSTAHGSYLDQDTHEYFLRVFEQSRQTFENDEEKRIFVENVFAQTFQHEVEYSKNQLVSRVLEDLLPLTGSETFERFTAAFTDHLRAACVHSYASHVVEKMVSVSTIRVHDLAKESPSTYQNSASFAFVMKVSKFLANNLDEFVSDNYANHVTRATISCLANILPEKQREKGKNSKIMFEVNSTEKGLNLEKMNKSSTFDPPEFVEVLEDIANRILNSPSFVDFPSDSMLSALLQNIMLSLHAVGKENTVNSIFNKLLQTTYVCDPNCSELPEVLTSPSHLFLLETVLGLSDEKLFTKIYEQCFKGRLAMLAKGRFSCFTFAKLVQRCDDKEKFLSMYVEITEGDSLGEIAHSPAYLILATVANACRRLKTKQKTFIKDISKALNVDSSALLPALLNYEVKSVTPIHDKKRTYSFAGCVILQELLRFEKRSKIVKGLFALENDELVRIFSDPKGSYIAESFFSVGICTDEQLEIMINKLQGSFAKLATSRHGSFALTALWDRCPPVTLKTKVIEELAITPLSRIGGVVATKIDLRGYQINPKQWTQNQMKVAEGLEKKLQISKNSILNV
ncbi:nucleolar protein 9 [Nilaparvata lugens]|uniref:nucleolar protein 9 n=1 Tax=Nilaparvata lugens TaxID=108931 RepID=UPI00193E5478|nr:nucleolar protein 9 [Nilaparvata lugens]